MSKLSFKDFLKLKPLRNEHIEKASSEQKKYEYTANTVAKLRHPKTQHGVISDIKNVTKDIKEITITPDTSLGTDRFALFESGQYISVKYDINGIKTARPYSLSSSSSKDEYKIAIKLVEGGLTSTYAHNNFKIGDKLEFSSPEGQFYHEPLRDSKNITGIAGGSGITPFLSIARSIKNGKNDISLSLIYGAKTISDIAFKEELDEIEKACPNFNVTYVLSDEKNDKYEYGFITKEIIEKHSSSDSSYFVCGPKAMMISIDHILESMNIEKKRKRSELIGEAMNIKEFTDCPENLPESVKITVKVRDEVFTFIGSPLKTILRNIEEKGTEVLNRCRSGVCGFCHSFLEQGKVFIPKVMDHLREADRIYSQIHLCSAFPITDIKIEIAKPGGNL